MLWCHPFKHNSIYNYDNASTLCSTILECCIHIGQFHSLIHSFSGNSQRTYISNYIWMKPTHRYIWYNKRNARKSEKRNEYEKCKELHMHMENREKSKYCDEKQNNNNNRNERKRSTKQSNKVKLLRDDKFSTIHFHRYFNWKKIPNNKKKKMLHADTIEIHF